MYCAPWDAVRPLLRSFDCIAFRKSEMPATLLISATQLLVHGAESPWRYVHLALVVRRESLPAEHPARSAIPEDTIALFESIKGGGPLMPDTRPLFAPRARFIGVQLTDGDAAISAALANGGAAEACWLPLKRAARARILPDRWPRVFDEYAGTGFEMDVVALCAACGCWPLRQLASSPRSPLRRCSHACARDCLVPFIECIDEPSGASESKPWMTCSALVTSVYQRIGVLPMCIDPQNVIPADVFTRPGGNATFDADGQLPSIFERPIAICARTI